MGQHLFENYYLQIPLSTTTPYIFSLPFSSTPPMISTYSSPPIPSSAAPSSIKINGKTQPSAWVINKFPSIQSLFLITPYSIYGQKSSILRWSLSSHGISISTKPPPWLPCPYSFPIIIIIFTIFIVLNSILYLSLLF